MDATTLKSIYETMLAAPNVRATVTVAHQPKAARDLPIAERTPLGSAVWSSAPRTVVALDTFTPTTAPEGVSLLAAVGMRYAELIVLKTNTQTPKGMRAYAAVSFGPHAIQVSPIFCRPGMSTDTVLDVAVRGIRKSRRTTAEDPSPRLAARQERQ